jgi:hypothetical protein
VIAGEQLRRAVWGLVATVAMTAIATRVWGRSATVAAATFGGVATIVQLLAARMMAKSGTPAAVDHLKVYGTGVIFRLLGVVIFALAVSVDRATFPPLASATGYLGTVLPLLYLETRLHR